MNRLKNVPVNHADKTSRHAAAGAVVPGKDFESAHLGSGLVFPDKSTMLVRRQNHYCRRANENKTDD